LLCFVVEPRTQEARNARTVERLNAQRALVASFIDRNFLSQQVHLSSVMDSHGGSTPVVLLVVALLPVQYVDVDQYSSPSIAVGRPPTVFFRACEIASHTSRARAFHSAVSASRSGERHAEAEKRRGG
jgi:hypothetical protein